MVPVIRISDANYGRLKEWAIPLEDTVDDALGKALTAAREHLDCTNGSQENKPEFSPRTAKRRVSSNCSGNGLLAKGRRLQKGESISTDAYKLPILEILYELGGGALCHEVLEHVEPRMRTQLKDVDYEPISSGGEIRWHKRANWARFLLVKEGLLKDDSNRGFWELSKHGIVLIEQLQAN